MRPLARLPAQNRSARSPHVPLADPLAPLFSHSGCFVTLLDLCEGETRCTVSGHQRALTQGNRAPNVAT